SSDPVALDKACADAVNQGRVVTGSMLEKNRKQKDYITTVNPKTDWIHSLEYAFEIGLGSLEYDLISLDK
ncbi:MAG TPA: 4Fe-4S ferredoxin, partial [Clostridia bacterium]|nr:4Fe-4S ferredoxin [Clostridia bacterium]